MLGKKHREIRDLILRHVALVGESVEQLRKMVADYLADDDAFKKESLRVHELESKADKIRYQVERLMYEGALLPAYRQDYIDLLETLDRVANKAEEAADTITLVRPSFAPSLHVATNRILEITVEQWALVPPLIERLLGGDYDVSDSVRQIARLESRVDEVQFEATRSAYKEDALDRAQKLELLIVFERLAAVSDRLENVADHIALLSVRRRMA